MPSHRYRLQQLAQLLDVTLVGEGDYEITGLATLQSAGAGQLGFLANPRYRKDLSQTRAGAVIVAADMVEHSPCHCLVSERPYETYARASQLFRRERNAPVGVHPTAVVAGSAVIHASASIGAHCTIEEDVEIGADCVVFPGVYIGARTRLGQGCVIRPNVAIYHDVQLGDRVSLHSGVVVGSDGFGYAPAADFQNEGYVKIAQLGGVRIGHDVEIGAGSTIDRGALDDTVIGNRVIIDNQVQIAHNVVIGDNTGIAGCAAISGSSRVGRNCTIAGGVGIVGHITIADGVHITAMSMVTKSISQAGSYSSGTPMMTTREWRRSAVRFSQLDDLARRLASLKKDS